MKITKENLNKCLKKYHMKCGTNDDHEDLLGVVIPELNILITEESPRGSFLRVNSYVGNFLKIEDESAVYILTNPRKLVGKMRYLEFTNVDILFIVSIGGNEEPDPTMDIIKAIEEAAVMSDEKPTLPIIATPVTNNPATTIAEPQKTQLFKF